MLVRLTRMQRLKAGWIVALVYLLCVLAPTISYALPGEHSVAPCLTGESHMTGMVHVRSDAPAQHVHGDGHVHDYSAAHSSVQSDGDHRSVSVALNGKSVPQKAPHSSDAQCCGLMCISALPATLIDIGTPSAPTALCEIEGSRKVTDNAPSRLYRPPIS
jgi:hypothetical protein